MNNRIQHKEDLTPGLEVWRGGSFRVLKLPSNLYQVERWFTNMDSWVSRKQAFNSPLDCLNYILEVLERENLKYKTEAAQLRAVVDNIDEVMARWKKG